MSRILIVTRHGDTDQEGHLTEHGSDQAMSLGLLIAAAKGLTINRAAGSGIQHALETAEDILIKAGAQKVKAVSLPALLDDLSHHSQQFIDDRSVAHTTLREATFQEYLTLSKPAMASYGLIAAQHLQDFLDADPQDTDALDVILVVTHCVYANAMLWSRYQGKMSSKLESHLLNDPALGTASGYIIHEDAGHAISMEHISWDMPLPRA